MHAFLAHLAVRCDALIKGDSRRCDSRHSEFVWQCPLSWEGVEASTLLNYDYLFESPKAASGSVLPCIKTALSHAFRIAIKIAAFHNVSWPSCRL